MSEKIKVAILGYGNLARGAEAAIHQTPDMELFAVFTRRDPQTIQVKTPDIPVLHLNEAEKFINDIDVMLLCGSSASDLPEQGPHFAKMFNTVDSFDTHVKIPDYFHAVDQSAKASGKVGIISAGWDPGLFSLNRMLMEAVLPDGRDYTFWGKGVSQGHSDAIRRVKGVKYGIQYTIPMDSALEKVRQGMNPELTTRDKHLRDCYVVPEEGADKEKIINTIQSIPNYFADNETRVTFITEEEMKKNHGSMPHGGFVIRSGATGAGKNQHILEFSLKLGSNPEFTGSVLVAYARAAYKLNREGQTGAKTVLDIPLTYLSYKTPEALRKELL